MEQSSQPGCPPEEVDAPAVCFQCVGLLANVRALREQLNITREKLKKVMPWVGCTFLVCPFCERSLVVQFHKSDCILYTRPPDDK